jgi:ABC-type transport system involved in multi-copper enzyme maturation permease subunit
MPRQRPAKPSLREDWLGPHFYYDLIRIARKGWPTAVRVLFLAVVLVSLLIMDRTQGQSVHFTRLEDFARRAQNFAYLLIVLQYLLVLALLPVYVASSIAEEKENQTLESLTLTHLSDRELILGKLGARLVHVGGFALANFPLLAFMLLWGNVDGTMLLYHEIHLFMLLISAGSICIRTSTYAESAFQAISNSYLFIGMLGAASMAAAFAMPWMCGPCLYRDGSAHYGTPLILLGIIHGIVTVATLRDAIAQVEVLRHEERKKPRKLTGALTLTDNRPVSTRTGKRGQVKSRVHPWAWPIKGNALFWKECLKDGTDYSLSARWFFIGLAVVVVVGGIFRLLYAVMPRAHDGDPGIRAPAYTFTFVSYIIALGVYGLVVLFQMTMSVAAEREHGTLTFLLSVPDDRRTILFAKWLVLCHS